MWCSLLRTTARERHAGLLRRNSRHVSSSVAVQLDYYMSLQFAGVATALVNNIYADKGLGDVQFLPTCPVGLELQRVRDYQTAHPETAVTIGSVEQNVFTPLLHDNPHLRVTAVASMFRKSPLCVASLGRPLQEGDLIGAHEDTVDLLQRIFPQQRVVASPRSTKNTDLLSGKYAGIQAYTTTEVPALQRLVGDDEDLVVTSLEGENNVQLGYSQMLFAASECLENDKGRTAARAFLDATFEGWQMAIRDPDQGIAAVKEAQHMLQLDDEANDHWHQSLDFQREMLELCNSHVKESFQGDRLGVLHPKRWANATEWLLEDKGGSVDPLLGFDTTGLWQPPKHLLAGNELAHAILEDANKSAVSFANKYGRKPTLAVITVGDLQRYGDAERRIQLYSNPSNSWFSKTNAGAANGFDVTEIHLDAATTTTGKLLSELYKIRDQVDGIQAMWPFPYHIDSARVFNAIPFAKDVDGIHYIGQQELGNKNAYPPVTPAGAMDLIKEYGVQVKGKQALVVGRSLIVGSPMAHMLRQAGAAVTVAHTEVSADTLEKLVGQADVLVTCAGLPGVIQAGWLKVGAAVVNVGTTFQTSTDKLHSDVEGDIAISSHWTPVPGGVGPMSVPVLFRNVANAAWDQMEDKGAAAATWEHQPAVLKKTFHFDSYTAALQFATEVDNMSTVMDHHANMTFVHRCVNGVDVTMDFSSYQAKELTEIDFHAAKAVDMLYGDHNEIKMSEYSYHLNHDSIAKFPAEPRGSSKLLRVASTGTVSYHNNFAESIPSLLEGSHLVLNNSLVLDARLSVQLKTGQTAELMILDLGSVEAEAACKRNELDAMIRSDTVAKGDICVEPISGCKIEVVDVRGVWEEEEESGGNGTECVVRIHSEESITDFLGKSGTVPIPPYFNREAVPSDKDRYNNVYAKDGGSVAAPTAGLHFTDDVLKKLGSENISNLTLHVGAGTFMPVLSEDARQHSMHGETFAVNVGEVRRIIRVLEEGKPLVVVGTTSTRTLETLFWCGVKRFRGLPNAEDSHQLELKQFEWVPLSVGNDVSAVAALKALVAGLPDEDVIGGRTSLMITPDSYKFRVVDHLITNFHAPDSTLMLLVSSFLGNQNQIKTIYEDVQKRGYRFLSYGDVCMFSRPGSVLSTKAE